MDTFTTSSENQAKSLSTTGFVIALVSILLWFVGTPLAILQALNGGGMGLAGISTVFCILGIVFSCIGLLKGFKMHNVKRGLAVSGLVIAIIATGLCVRTVYSVKETQNIMSKSKNALKDLNQAFNMSYRNYKRGAQVNKKRTASKYVSHNITKPNSKYKRTVKSKGKN